MTKALRDYTARVNAIAAALAKLGEDLSNEANTRPLTTFLYRHWDAVTPCMPEGYDTVLGFLAKHHADVLDLIDYSDPRVTQRDGWKLAHLTRQAGLPVIYVPAPECLAARGFKTVRAYPISLMQQRWT